MPPTLVGRVRPTMDDEHAPAPLSKSTWPRNFKTYAMPPTLVRRVRPTIDGQRRTCAGSEDRRRRGSSLALSCFSVWPPKSNPFLSLASPWKVVLTRPTGYCPDRVPTGAVAQVSNWLDDLL